jgi:hypothetical protein
VGDDSAVIAVAGRRTCFSLVLGNVRLWRQFEGGPVFMLAV